jgi:hypothetical protein
MSQRLLLAANGFLLYFGWWRIFARFAVAGLFTFFPA